jgi:hypothetical protein
MLTRVSLVSLVPLDSVVKRGLFVRQVYSSKYSGDCALGNPLRRNGSGHIYLPFLAYEAMLPKSYTAARCTLSIKHSLTIGVTLSS